MTPTVPDRIVSDEAKAVINRALHEARCHADVKASSP